MITLRYRRLSTRMWVDEHFLALSAPRPNAKYLWVFLLTGPHTTAIPGLFSAGEAGLAEALAWPLKGFRACFEEIRSLGMARADWPTRVVWIPKAINHNPPQSANVIIAWAKAADEIPPCELKQEALRHLAEKVSGEEGIHRAFLQAFGEALAKPSWKALEGASGTQEQEAGYRSQETPRKPPKGGDWPGFTEFWIQYPKKQDEEQARAAWNKLRPDEALRAEILKAVTAQSTWPQWTENSKYIPLAWKWIIRKRWKDEATTAGNGHHPGRYSNAAWEDPYEKYPRL